MFQRVRTWLYALGDHHSAHWKEGPSESEDSAAVLALRAPAVGHGMGQISLCLIICMISYLQKSFQLLEPKWQPFSQFRPGWKMA